MKYTLTFHQGPRGGPATPAPTGWYAEREGIEEYRTHVWQMPRDLRRLLELATQDDSETIEREASTDVIGEPLVLWVPGRHYWSGRGGMHRLYGPASFSVCIIEDFTIAERPWDTSKRWTLRGVKVRELTEFDANRKRRKP